MNRIYVRRWFIVAVTLGALLATSTLLSHSAVPAQNNGALALQRPAFLGVAHAETGQVSSFADDEAGIAAYININQAVDLAKVRAVCRTVEAQTVDYIICSVPIKDYDENHDAKV